MDRNEQIAAAIRDVCRQQGLLADLAEDEDFFDNGLSSLAVIQIQIRIEEALHVTVPTSDLMGQPTVRDWISLYIRTASALTETDAPAELT